MGGTGFMAGLLGGFAGGYAKDQVEQEQSRLEELKNLQSLVLHLSENPNLEPKLQQAAYSALLESMEAKTQPGSAKKKTAAAMTPLATFQEMIKGMPAITQPAQEAISAKAEERPLETGGAPPGAQLPAIPSMQTIPGMPAIARVPGMMRSQVEVAQERGQAQATQDIIARQARIQAIQADSSLTAEQKQDAISAEYKILARVPGSVAPGNYIPDPTVPGGYREVGKKLPPVPSDVEQRVQDDLEARGLPNTARNRYAAYLRLKALEGAAGREPKVIGDIEEEANDYADSLEKGTLTWSQVPIKMRGKVTGIVNKRGSVILNTKQREALQSSERAGTIINAIDEASKKVHSGAKVPGQKWISGLGETGASIAFPSGNPDLDALQSGAAALGPIIRNLGEMGNLSEGDIARAVAAVPVSRFLTRKEAEARLSKLREFVSASRNAIQAVAGKTAKELFKETSTPAAGPRVGDTKQYQGAIYKFNGTQWVKQ